MEDNAALYHALKRGTPVLPLFIFDTDILSKLEDRQDARIEFIHLYLNRLKQSLQDHHGDLLVMHGRPLDIFSDLLEKYDVSAIYTNHDYEPYAVERDNKIAALCQSKRVAFKTYKDQVIFEKDEVVSNNGTPYTVYTPYSRKWKNTLNPFYLSSYPVERYTANLLRHAPPALPSLNELGFKKTGRDFPPVNISASIINNYAETRDLIPLNATSHLGAHLRFGTISIRKLAKIAVNKSEAFLNELIWREFFQSVLWHFPRVVDHSFRKGFDKIEWRNDEKEFRLWCLGKTGYPLVDAGMRELNETGFMHNRVRMLAASFLCRHLLIDWRWGEHYFGQKLLDYDLAANNGNWQWAAGTGCDAAPYFRIFSPEAQQKKFDPHAIYIRRWVKEYGTPAYPKPVIAHQEARERALKAYRAALI